MRIFALILSCLAAPVSAHELWLEPLNYQIASDGRLEARIVNGELFEGTALPYIPQRFKHFIAFAGGQNTLVGGRPGDTPGLNIPALDSGLHVVVYQSTPSIITYEDWAKFQKFVDHKDLGDALSIAQTEGLAQSDFAESYTRYSKTLIGAGAGAGADLRTGLLTELVALDNPYADDVSAGLRVQLFYGQDLRANAQVELFEKAADGTVNVTLHRTDDDGIATLPVQPGHAYMADAVVLRRPTAQLTQDTDAVWETLWANLTFAVPE